jgi:hypothetical protein
MPKKKAKRRRRHECNGALCFHGAFKSAGAAESKRKSLGKSAFVVKKFGRWGRGAMHTRHVVMTQDRSGVPF